MIYNIPSSNLPDNNQPKIVIENQNKYLLHKITLLQLTSIFLAVYFLFKRDFQIKELSWSVILFIIMIYTVSKVIQNIIIFKHKSNDNKAKILWLISLLAVDLFLFFSLNYIYRSTETMSKNILDNHCSPQGVLTINNEPINLLGSVIRVIFKKNKIFRSKYVVIIDQIKYIFIMLFVSFYMLTPSLLFSLFFAKK